MVAGEARADTEDEAPAEPEAFLPVQVDFEVELLLGTEMWTSGIYFTVSYVRVLTNLGGGWSAFGGVGFADDVVTQWQRDDRRVPDAITALHAPGIEGRVGIIHGTQLGAPRFVAKLTPMWARGATSMALPGDRGLGLRASVGATSLTTVPHRR